MLHKGQRFTMGGLRWRVEYVNFSRAHCVTIMRERVRVKERSFVARKRLTADISPNTCVELLS